MKNEQNATTFFRNLFIEGFDSEKIMRAIGSRSLPLPIIKALVETGNFTNLDLLRLSEINSTDYLQIKVLEDPSIDKKNKIAAFLRIKNTTSLHRVLPCIDFDNLSKDEEKNVFEHVKQKVSIYFYIFTKYAMNKVTFAKYKKIQKRRNFSDIMYRIICDANNRHTHDEFFLLTKNEKLEYSILYAAIEKKIFTKHNAVDRLIKKFFMHPLGAHALFPIIRTTYDLSYDEVEQLKNAHNIKIEH